MTANFILIMKVGYHAEDFSAILARKRIEEQEIGHCYWGYGGTLCHPTRIVHPFASTSGPVIVLFTLTKSPFRGEPSAIADEYSVDGQKWASLPGAAKIVSSRYALVLKDLKPANLSIDLNEFMAVSSQGDRPLAEFFRFRVDKAVARRVTTPLGETTNVPISFSATLLPPYAIWVRRRPSP